MIAARYSLKPAAVEQWLERTHWVARRTSAEGALASAREMLIKAGAI
jgi:hypothetical protein